MPRTPTRLKRISRAHQRPTRRRTAHLRAGLVAALIGFTGCAGNSHLARNSIQPDAGPLVASLDPSAEETTVWSAPAERDATAKTVTNAKTMPEQRDAVPAPEPSSPIRQTAATSRKTIPSTSPFQSSREITDGVVADSRITDSEITDSGVAGTGVLTINGRQYALKLVDETDSSADEDETSFAQRLVTNPLDPRDDSNELAVYDGGLPNAVPLEQASPATIVDDSTDGMMPQPVINENVLDLNLPSALAMVGGAHPVVGMAQWRVKEAYANLAQARVLWLPSISAGFSFHRHDGNYQASNADIVDVNRNSFQYGLGTGATGAGTTPRPGLVARFHLADALFQPKVAEKTAWARGHAAKAVMNQQLLEVAQAYTELVGAHQDVSILNETRDRTANLLKITTDFSEAGQGLQADADRMQTELALVESRIALAQERVAVASARMAQAISVDGSQQILPLDVVAIPIDFAVTDMDQAGLIGTGLATRPELCESQALVAAACEAYRREKYAPFVPSVLLGFSTGGFGGGLGNNLSDVDGRYDLDALMSWEVRNLGFGEKAARQRSAARIQQAKFQKLRVMDEVARQVSEAAGQLRVRRQRVEITQQAIASAEQSYDRNLDRIQDGQGLPIEVLQSVQALEQARRGYLQAIVDHNQSQYALQWALGWPIQQP